MPLARFTQEQHAQGTNEIESITLTFPAIQKEINLRGLRARAARLLLADLREQGAYLSACFITRTDVEQGSSLQELRLVQLRKKCKVEVADMLTVLATLKDEKARQTWLEAILERHLVLMVPLEAEVPSDMFAMDELLAEAEAAGRAMLAPPAATLPMGRAALQQERVQAREQQEGFLSCCLPK